MIPLLNQVRHTLQSFAHNSITPLNIGFVICYILTLIASSRLPMYFLLMFYLVYFMIDVRPRGYYLTENLTRTKKFILAATFITLIFPTETSLFWLPSIGFYILSTKFTKVDLQTLGVKFMLQFFSILFFLLGYGMLFKMGWNTLNHYSSILNMILTILLVFYIVHMLITSIVFTVKSNKELFLEPNRENIQDRSHSNKAQLIVLVSILALLMVLGDFMFGMLYSLEHTSTLDIFNHPTSTDVPPKLSFFQYVFFTFGIHYSLPLPEDLSKFQEFVSTEPKFMVVQMSHALSSKLMEITIFAALGGQFAEFLMRNQKSREE
ncbi:hypothetical protein [Brevibacillus dissolubilis]|uniref:hypothetical protein n=1 Tax=Brevibacillus dissolubilis TaxID=1844116 RepID=UPI001115CD79|nr:hypothetical protein [Brevibacillus dissolubilis]